MTNETKQRIEGYIVAAAFVIIIVLTSLITVFR